MIARRFGNFFRSASPTVSRQPLMEGLETRSLLSASLTLSPIPSPIVTPPIVVPVDTNGITIHEEAGEQFTAKLGTFTAIAPNLDDHVTISWGDGTSSQAILKSNGFGIDTVNFDIYGTHTYRTAGQYTISMAVFGKGANDPFLSLTAHADVIPDTGDGGVKLTEVATQIFTARVATFDDVDGVKFTAEINWGDGHSSVGQVIKLANGDESVIGTHTYKFTGTYKIVVALTGRPVPIPGHPIPEYILLKLIDSTAMVFGKA